jgi:chemotaxis protein histidine kinase CheA
MEVQLLTKELEQIQEGASFDLDKLTIPTTIKDKVLLAPGNWNGLEFSAGEIVKAFANTDWNDKKNYELIKDHDNSVDSLVGYVRNIKLNNEGAIVGDLELWDEKMIKNLLVLKAKFGISAKVIGIEMDGDFKDFTFNNFSIVDEPACKKAYINLSQLKKKEIDVFSGFMNGYEFAELKDKKLEELREKKVAELSEEENTYRAKKEETKMQEEEQKDNVAEEAAPVEEVAEEVKESEELSSMRSAIEMLTKRVAKLEEEAAVEEVVEESPVEEVVEEVAEEVEAPVEEATEEAAKEEVAEEASELSQLKKEVAELKAKGNSPKSFSVQELKAIGARADRHSEGILKMSEALLKSIQ